MRDYPSRIRFAVAGMGRIGQRHAKLILNNPDAELVAFCEPNLDLHVDIPCKNINRFDSIHDMYKNGVYPDVVNICTPNGYHAQHCIEAMAHGSHVICEKPMTLTSADAKAMISQSEKSGSIIFCVTQNRYSAPSVWIKQVIDKQLLGDIFIVQITCFWNRDARYYRNGSWHGNAQLDGGTLFTQFSHYIDTLYWLFGDITDISARFADFTHENLTEFEDSGIIHFNLANGGIGSISYSTSVWDANLESSMTVIGQYGSVKIAGQYMERIEFCNIKNICKPALSEELKENHQFVIQNVIDTLRGKAMPDSAAREGAKIVDIIERIYAEKHKL